MSTDTAVTTDANTAVISAIRAHHAQLASQLRALTADVLTSARAGGDAAPARKALQDWYRTELVPHAVAEEHALYSEGAELDRTRLLIDGMIAEHRSLVGLIGELGLARSAFDASTVAASALALFEVHLSKENDLLLPALDRAGIDLAAVLDGMHEILGGHDHDAEAGGSDGGCGCSHEHADGDPDVFILSNMNNVGAVEVNAFQAHSRVLIQKSTKEGFGLTVTEALWKARPMVAGRVGGIVAQIADGETGWLVDSIDECAQACIEILRDPDEARTRALKGKEHVRRHFLTPRLLRDWLVLFNKLAGNDTGGSEITIV